MAGRKRRRDESHAIRRRDHYLEKLRAAGRSETGRVGAAADYVRALLVDAEPQMRQHVGEQVVGLLLSAATALEPDNRKGGRR